MIVKKYILIPLSLALGWAVGANGFRSCDMADSYAWSASTHCTVGEIAFDAVTGTASGEMLASGSWQAGRAVYKTPEECTLF